VALAASAHGGMVGQRVMLRQNSPTGAVCMGSDYCQKLLADVGGGMITTMGRDRTQQATPDLFSTTPVGEGTSPTTKEVSSAQEQRHVLPKDLPNAVKHLTDRELDLLITASVEEAKRRGRVPPSVQPNPPSDESVPKRSSSRDKRRAEVATVSLTRGQVNAIRAALKAGIKPSLIARQFGVSQSDVRKVLASDTTTRRGT
jgi:hypothetical protein